MTDLKMVKKCAEAMGYEVRIPIGATMETAHVRDLGLFKDGVFQPVHPYDPLSNDAQAMALEDYLAERGEVIFEYGRRFIFISASNGWSFETPCIDKQGRRRAICECVAKMETTK